MKPFLTLFQAIMFCGFTNIALAQPSSAIQENIKGLYEFNSISGGLTHKKYEFCNSLKHEDQRAACVESVMVQQLFNERVLVILKDLNNSMNR